MESLKINENNHLSKVLKNISSKQFGIFLWKSLWWSTILVTLKAYQVAGCPVKYLQIGSSAIAYEKFCFFVVARFCFWILKRLKMYFQVVAESFQNSWKHCQLFYLFLINLIQMNKNNGSAYLWHTTFMRSLQIMFIGIDSENWFSVRIGRSSQPREFYEKGVLKNFAKFTGKYLCQSLFLIKLQTWGLQLY